MYELKDIYDIAIQIERNGEKEYSKAARQTTNLPLKQLYLEMARQEGEHAKWFTKLREQLPESSSENELSDINREMLQNIVKSASFPIDEEALKAITDPVEALQFSISLEEDTATFYQFLTDLIEDNNTKKELQRIIEEEKLHARNMKEALHRWQQ